MRFKAVPKETNTLNMKGKPWNLRRSYNHTPQPYAGSSIPKAVETGNTVRCERGFPLNIGKKANVIPSTSCKKRSNDFEERVPIYNPQILIPRSPHSSSSRQRVAAALLSIVAGMALLTYMISLFFGKVQTLESEAANRNGLSASPVSTRSLFQSQLGLSGGREIHFRRRLASTEAANSEEKIPPRKSYLSRKVERFRQNMGSRQVFMSLLNVENGTITANALGTVFSSHYAWFGPSKAIPSPSGDDDKYTTVDILSIYHVRNGRPETRPTDSLQSIQTKQKRQKEHPGTFKTHAMSKAHGGAPRNLKSSQERANVPHKKAQNVVGEIAPVTSFKSTGLKHGQEPNLYIVHDHGQRPNASERLLQSVNSKQRMEPDKLKGNRPHRTQGKETATLSQGMIEIWVLRSGTSLCRIYNVGRLLEGKLILPAWMKEHSTVLAHQCGVKDPIFAIKSNSDNKQFVFDKKGLNMTGQIRIIDNANMDLFSSSAPRPHMPHFVSDILVPLIATEVLKGSGNGVTKFASIRMSSSPNSLEVTRAAFPDLKPSLFLKEEMGLAKSSAWVHRLAGFFSHPAVGFALLSEEDRRGLNRRVPYNKNNVVWRFRSVLSSNFNQYEPEGLFDVNGNSFVLSHNGLSREPAWAISGIAREPCRVSVIALTRRGPRALLHLDVLRKEAATLFASRGLMIDFKVVKFENTGFNTQVKTMQGTNVLIATHGAGNANLIFLRRGATLIEIFPFAYRAGPFDRLARTFGLEYRAAMSAPQTREFKECMNRHEGSDDVRRKVFGWWDRAVAEEKRSPYIHRLELEKEFGEPGKPEGMATRRCVRMQQLAFDTKAVAAIAFESAKKQCNKLRFRSRPVHVR